MLRFKSFHTNYGNYGENHESVIEMFNEFLETFEENDFIYLDHTTHFFFFFMVIIELKYKEQPIRKVMFEKVIS